MAFTSTDLTSIESAIITLAIGSRPIRVTFSNGHTIEYAEADLEKLKSLRSLIQTELGSTVHRAYAKNGGRALL